MDTFTVSFFGHRYIDNPFPVEKALDELIGALLRSHEYVEFLVGRNGDFDQLVSSTIRKRKREIRDDNSAHVWVLPYLTADFRDNEEDYRGYYGQKLPQRWKPVFWDLICIWIISSSTAVMASSPRVPIRR